jgi:vacuolar protein sorting-associated protein 45
LFLELLLLSPNRQPLAHLNCIAFLRPCRESIEAVKRELKGSDIPGTSGEGNNAGEGPRYGGYWLCEYAERRPIRRDNAHLRVVFSNILTKGQIEEMAMADEYETVKEVQVSIQRQELFLCQPTYCCPLGILCRLSATLSEPGYYEPDCPRRWSRRPTKCASSESDQSIFFISSGFNLHHELILQPPIYLPQPMSIPPPMLTHHTQMILSILLSLKKKPVIRWEKMSSGGKLLAQEVQVSPVVSDVSLMTVLRQEYSRL